MDPNRCPHQCLRRCPHPHRQRLFIIRRFSIPFLVVSTFPRPPRLLRQCNLRQPIRLWLQWQLQVHRRHSQRFERAVRDASASQTHFAVWMYASPSDRETGCENKCTGFVQQVGTQEAMTEKQNAHPHALNRACAGSNTSGRVRTHPQTYQAHLVARKRTRRTRHIAASNQAR